MLTFNTDGMIQQKFPFPAPIMDYIFKNVSASQLLKLYQTCKFFYDKFRLNIIESLEISDATIEQTIVGNSMTIWHQNPSLSKLKNLWISKSFTLYDFHGEHDELDFGKFSRLTYKRLIICGKYKVTEYEFFVQCPSLRHLTLDAEIFHPEDNSNLSFEECIERAPHVPIIDLGDDKEIAQSFPPIDMTKLLSIQRQTKLQSLHLYNISKIPDPALVVEFFKKHAIHEVDYFFGFDVDDTEYNVENVKRFYQIVNDGLRAWKLSLQLQPSITSSFINLTGKTALVTGASEGIGRATVMLFRQLGASVIAVAGTLGNLKGIVDECQNITSNGCFQTLWIPLMYTDTINYFNTSISCKFGSKVDILVNIADISEYGGVPANELLRKRRLDKHSIIKGRYEIIRETAPYLIKAKGCIINVSYPDGLITKPEDAKSIKKFEKRIRNAETELSFSGVRINTINPGALVSPLHPAGINDIAYQRFEQESKNNYDKQIAKTIAFLASDAALIHGSTLNVNAPNLH